MEAEQGRGQTESRRPLWRKIMETNPLIALTHFETARHVSQRPSETDASVSVMCDQEMGDQLTSSSQLKESQDIPKATEEITSVILDKKNTSASSVLRNMRRLIRWKKSVKVPSIQRNNNSATSGEASTGSCEDSRSMRITKADEIEDDSSDGNDQAQEDGIETEESTPISGFDWLNTNYDLMVWPPKDISASESDLYKDTLLEHVMFSKQLLCHELQHLCRMNFHRRLDVFCELLKHKRLSLNSELFKGNVDTPLNIALLNDSTEAAKILIKHGGPSLVKTVTNIGYGNANGKTHLHQAIRSRNTEVIHAIMGSLNEEEKRRILQIEAIGKTTKKAGTLPLTLAAIFGDTEIVDDLISYGAEVDATESSSGNNIFHTLVEYGKFNSAHSKAMIKHILESKAVQKWWLSKQDLLGLKMTPVENFRLKEHLLKKTNFDGYTPLTLSASLENVELCKTLLQTLHVYKHPQWTCGPTSFTYFDVSEVDPSIVKYGVPCVTTLFLYGKDIGDNISNYCTIPLIKEVLAQQWNRFKMIFYLWFFFHLLVMCDLTACLEIRRLSHNNPDTVHPGNVTTELPLTKHGFVFFPEEYIVLLAATLYLIADLFDIVRYSILYVVSVWKMYKERHIWLSKRHSAMLWWPEPFRTILFVFSVTYILAVFLRIKNSDWEPIAMSCACLFGWIFLLSFARALKNIGIFTIMLQRMLFTDILHFCIVYVTFAIAFTTAFRVLFISNTTTSIPEDIKDIPTTLHNIWQLTLGLTDFDIFERAANPTALKLLFLAFVLSASVLLLNMLIATMSDTYNSVSGQKEHLWLSLRAKSLAMIEAHLPPCLMPKHYLEHRKFKGRDGKEMWLLLVREQHELL